VIGDIALASRGSSQFQRVGLQTTEKKAFLNGLEQVFLFMSGDVGVANTMCIVSNGWSSGSLSTFTSLASGFP
jgi:hypothetical protein